MPIRHFFEGEEITRAQARELVRTRQAVVVRASPWWVPWRLGGGPGPWLEYTPVAAVTDDVGSEKR
jgi:hypothetical protein